jgi:hypothetical protein
MKGSVNMKVTKKVLRMKVEYLNYVTDRKGYEKYSLNYGYGGVKIVVGTNDKGGTADISLRGTKTEIGNILDTLLMFYQNELDRARS